MLSSPPAHFSDLTFCRLGQQGRFHEHKKQECGFYSEIDAE